MKRLLPHPLISLVVALTWLALAESLAAGQILIAALLGLLLPHWIGALVPHATGAFRPWAALRLAAHLLVDVLIANLQVAKRILGPEEAIRPRFIWMPLRIRNPYGVATLAAMISLTPGSLSADLSADGGWLLVHAFDVDDEAEMLERIRRRYEDPLLELFP